MKSNHRSLTSLALAAALALVASGCSEAAGTTSGGSATGSTKPAPSGAPKPSASVAKTAPAPAPSPSASAAPVAEPGEDVKVVALKITSGKETIELKEDGTVLADGKEFGKFTKNEFKSADGKHSLTVLKSGSILFDGKDEGAKFNEKNELIAKIGSMFIADDGTFSFKDPAGKDMPSKEKVVVTGFKPEARRAVELLMLAIVAAASDPAPAPAQSGSPAASGAPKAPPPS